MHFGELKWIYRLNQIKQSSNEVGDESVLTYTYAYINIYIYIGVETNMASTQKQMNKALQKVDKRGKINEQQETNSFFCFHQTHFVFCYFWRF